MTRTQLKEFIKETIRKVDGEYVVYPKKGGKRLGTHSSKKAAEKQLTAIHLNKENFADGKVKGKSKPGRVKKSGASCKPSITVLKKRVSKASGERKKMYQWCLNMKRGRKNKK